MDEYPKAIDVDGVAITARDAEDEAFWRAKPSPELVADPLESVSIEMDNPTYSEPKKKAKKTKK